jgi:hypothetical protein
VHGAVSYLQHQDEIVAGVFEGGVEAHGAVGMNWGGRWEMSRLTVLGLEVEEGSS